MHLRNGYWQWRSCSQSWKSFTKSRGTIQVGQLYKRAAQEFYGVSEKICGLFVRTCQVCHLKKSKKSLKSIVVKPISSTNFLSRAQIDLIDMSDQNPEVNLSPDGVTPYKFILVYIDHFTKKINVFPLKRKTAEEVTERLLDIFCDSGPPQILHSDNGKEFSNNLLFSTLAAKWPTLKIVHGKPRHPESQGAVERVNRDIKDSLFGMMHDHDNDQCWVKYLRWVQWNHNTSYHTAIRMSPYEAVYNKKPSIGLSNISIPQEFWAEINTKDDIDIFQKEIEQRESLEVDNELLDSIERSEFDSHYSQIDSPLSIISHYDEYDHVIPSPPPSKFPPIDEYDNAIVAPLPVGIIVHENLVPIRSESFPTPVNNSFAQNIQISNSPSNSYQVPSAESDCLNPSKECVVCCRETTGAHSCPYCFGNIHTICGRTEGEEGYGSSVVCPACDFSTRNAACDKIESNAAKKSSKREC